MYKLFTILVFFFYVEVAFAQAPYLDSTWLPINGDRYLTYSIDGNVPANAADTGANITWDFNSELGSYLGYPVDSYNFVYPAEWYIPCSNPDANFADGNDSLYYCYHKNDGGLFMTDYSFRAGKGKSYGSFTKPEAFIKCNLHFRDEYRDTAIYSYNFTVDHSDSPYRGIRYNYWKYDGYGNLKILGQEYDTVERLQISKTQKDSNLQSVAVQATKIYEWYVPSIHVPVLIMTTSWLIKPSGSGNDTIRRDDYITFNQVSTSPPPSPPSPGIEGSYGSFNDNSILIKGLRGTDINYDLYDISGKLIQSGRPLSIGTNTAEVMTNDLNQGVYILKITSSSGDVKSIKLIKSQ